MSSFPVLPPTTDNAGSITATPVVVRGRPAILLEWTWDTPNDFDTIPGTYDEIIQFIDPLGDPADPYNQAPGVDGYQVLTDVYLGDQGTGYPMPDQAAIDQSYLYFLPAGQQVPATLYFGAFQGQTGSEIFCGLNYVPPAGGRLLPDVEGIVINFLRTDPEVTGTLLGDRTFGRLPQDKSFPLQRVTRITSTMLEDVPGAEFEQVTLQVDTWGGQKADTQDIAQTTRAALARRLVQPGQQTEIVAVDLGSMAYLPDTDFKEPKARYTSDVLVTVRAAST